MKKNKGFTLIEMIVYISVLSIVFIIVVKSLMVVTSSFTKGRLLIKINESGSTGTERIVREIRYSYGYDAVSIFNSNPGRLKLNTHDSLGNETTVDFYLNAGKLMVSEGGGTAVELTSSGVQVSSLIFKTANSATAKSKSIKIEMQINGTQGVHQRTEKFYDSTILRESY